MKIPMNPWINTWISGQLLARGIEHAKEFIPQSTRLKLVPNEAVHYVHFDLRLEA
jgi:hypothetical protein